ncbi:MAG TPA: ankyrin repeat domain-containing protein [Bryobacteraceae bacterium]|jgi:ankyrin repeat protein
MKCVLAWTFLCPVILLGIDPDGTTDLHRAAFQGDVSKAESLIRGGADVKAVNRYGVTALSLACTNGDGAMVELLLRSGADPNTALPGGETALMTCARTGKVAAVQSLISHGAEIHAKEPKHGQDSLMWAAAEGNADVVEALIKAGADVHERLESGFTPFLFAVREGRTEVLKVLLRNGVDVNETIQNRRPGSKSPSQNSSPPSSGTSALSMAVANGHFELASYLLDRGADPNAAAQGWAPLHIITWVRKPGGGDNDPAPIGSGNMTSLELVKKLVAKGANINARMTKKANVGLTSLNTMGATAFFLAARTADAELMRALASLGADPLLKNTDDSTPLMAAAGLGTRSPGEDAGTESEVVEAMQVALDLGNDIDAVDKNGETAMHGAAYKNLPAAVEFLAAKGAKIEVWNRKNSHGWTPLTIAEGHRFGNFKPSFVTIDAFHRVMSAAGVPVPVE